MIDPKTGYTREEFEALAYCKPTEPVRQSKEFRSMLIRRDRAYSNWEVANSQRRLWGLYQYSERARVYDEEVRRLDAILLELLQVDLALYPEYPKVKPTEEEGKRLLREAMIQTRKEIENDCA